MGIGSAGVGVGALFYGFLQKYLVDEFSWRVSKIYFNCI